MLGDFYNSLKNNNNFQLPKAVLDVISSELPDNYGYVYDDQLKQYVAAPLDKNIPQTIDISFDKEQISDFPSWAKENNNTLMEYLYRTQTRLKINKAEIKGKDGKSCPISVLSQDPFSPKETIVEEFIFPAQFPEGKVIPFETESGKKRDIVIRRVPCDSREFIKMANVDFPALSLCAYLPDVGNKGPGKIHISVTPSKAESVLDAVFSLELLKGYADGTLKVNGKCLGKVLPDDPNYNKDSLEGKLKLWNTILFLQDKIGVEFNPQINMDTNDLRLFDELVRVFIYDKDIIYNSPVEFITVNSEAVDDPDFKQFANTDNSGLALSFVNGPYKHSLMGTNLELYTSNMLLGFKIDRIDYTNDGARLYIVNAGNEPWKSIKRYALSRDQADEEQKRMNKFYIAPSN